MQQVLNESQNKRVLSDRCRNQFDRRASLFFNNLHKNTVLTIIYRSNAFHGFYWI